MQAIRCELCGKESKQLMRAIIEGTEMKVCSACASFGKALGPALTSAQAQARLRVLAPKKEAVAETIHLIVPDFADRIRKGRDRLGLTQKEFAVKIAERESAIHQMESGHQKPSIEMARKLERALSCTLIETITADPASALGASVGNSTGTGQKKADPRSSQGFVLGDFIKKR